MSYAALKQFLKDIRRNPEQERREKIQQMLQLKNVVRSRRTKVCYSVVEVNLGSAMLLDSAGDLTTPRPEGRQAYASLRARRSE